MPLLFMIVKQALTVAQATTIPRGKEVIELCRCKDWMFSKKVDIGVSDFDIFFHKLTYSVSF
jgi:hypothetical protein